jgi:hypothetical protein
VALHGVARLGRRGEARLGWAWRGWAGVARLGEAGRGAAGQAWHGLARLGVARLGRRGVARQGEAGSGLAWNPSESNFGWVFYAHKRTTTICGPLMPV